MFGSMPVGLRRRPNPAAIQSFLASVNRRNATASASTEQVDTVVITRADKEFEVNFPTTGDGNIPLDGNSFFFKSKFI